MGKLSEKRVKSEVWFENAKNTRNQIIIWRWFLDSTIFLTICVPNWLSPIANFRENCIWKVRCGRKILKSFKLVSGASFRRHSPLSHSIVHSTRVRSGVGKVRSEEIFVILTFPPYCTQKRASIASFRRHSSLSHSIVHVVERVDLDMLHWMNLREAVKWWGEEIFWKK